MANIQAKSKIDLYRFEREVVSEVESQKAGASRFFCFILKKM